MYCNMYVRTFMICVAHPTYTRTYVGVKQKEGGHNLPANSFSEFNQIQMC